MTEDSSNGMSTWGALVGVVGGAALGYWAGRSSDNCGCGNKCGCGCNGNWNNGFAFNGYPTCGLSYGGYNSFEAGKTQAQVTAGLDFTAQGINGVKNDIVTLSDKMSAGFQSIMDRQFQMLVSENQSLRNELYTTNSLNPVKYELANIGCAVSCLKQNQVSAFKAVPLCTTCPTATTTTTA